MSFLQKLKNRGWVEEKRVGDSPPEGSPSETPLSGGESSESSSPPRWFERALSHEGLFKMLMMTLLLCVAFEPALAVNSLGEVLESSTGYADLFTKTLIVGGTGLGAVQCLRQGNVLLAFGVVISGALIGLMLGAVEDDSYRSLLG